MCWPLSIAAIVAVAIIWLPFVYCLHLGYSAVDSQTLSLHTGCFSKKSGSLASSTDFVCSTVAIVVSPVSSGSSGSGSLTKSAILLLLAQSWCQRSPSGPQIESYPTEYQHLTLAWSMPRATEDCSSSGCAVSEMH